MRILDTIMSSILGRRSVPEPVSAGMPPVEPRSGVETRAAAETVSAPPPTPTATQAPHPAGTERSLPQASPRPSPRASGAAPSPSAPPPHQVDVAAVLDKRAEETDEELNWRTSIVDLMKLLKLDSSLAARKALAKELSYTGDTKDTAAMNIWLHRQVMAKLAAGGGKLPADMLH